MATLLALLPDLRARHGINGLIRLERASGTHHEPVWLDSIEDLERALETAPNPLLILDSAFLHEEVLPHLEQLLAEHPNPDVILYGAIQEMKTSATSHTWIVPRIEAASAVVRRGIDDDAATFRDIFIRSLGARFTRRWLGTIRGRSYAAAEIAVRILQETSRKRFEVSAWAKVVGVSERSLRRWLGGRTSGTPGQLISYGRLYHVARLRAYEDRRPGQVAHVAGFSHSSNMNRSIRTHLALDPDEIVGFKGLEMVAEKWAAVLWPSS